MNPFTAYSMVNERVGELGRVARPSIPTVRRRRKPLRVSVGWFLVSFGLRMASASKGVKESMECPTTSQSLS